jgi:hypothetical protein
LWLVLAGYGYHTGPQVPPWVGWGGGLILFLLLVVIGLALFGSPLEGGGRRPVP